MNLQDQTTSSLKKVTMTRLSNAANWHGAQAAKAYRRRDMVTYLRHVRIADKLWRRVK
jgi:hypothetical protein